MSADNWAICPKCLHRARADLVVLAQRAADGYGVLPMAEFDALRAELDKGLDHEKYRTFREDYELHLDSVGDLNVSYVGSCSECGLKHEFQVVRDVWDARKDGAE